MISVLKPIKKDNFLLMIQEWVSKINTPTDGSITANTSNIDPEPSLPPKTLSILGTKENANQLDDAPMDYPRALKEFEDDDEFLAEVLEEFIENVDEQLIVMEQAISAKDSETLRKESHSIKGGSANLTAMNLSTVAHDLELIGKSGNLDNSATVFEKLKIEFDQLKNYILK